ncbi:MAG: DNA polymerase III subunit alpha [Legionellales bacterium]|nr:DNA polymerase III subunit alpha [Legionellales bacterium]
MTIPFIHLRLHSEYSLIDGLVRIDELISHVVEADMPAVALTDQAAMFATVKFYTAAESAGVKPLIGADIWLENPENPATPFNLLLLCQNNEGYRNLTLLISRAYTEGQQHGMAQVKREWIENCHEGLIALSGAAHGDIGEALLKNRPEQAAQLLDDWLTLFPNRFYIELQRTGRLPEDEYIAEVLPLAQATNTPIVATNDVRFLEQSDFEAHEARVAIHNGFTLADPKRPKLYSPQQFLRTPQEMQQLFADLPAALENTIQIAKRCTVTLTLGKPCLPDFPLPDGYTTERYFAEVSEAGLEKRLLILLKTTDPDYPAKRQPYDDRLKIELDVINKMGFAGYFLIVADFIQWAKNNGIPVGPGRGSGAGSLVAYALGITDLDPLEYDLLFERFLNPERVSMPDFDIDFCMDGRDRVIDYVAQKYGRHCVSQIITYGTMAAKAVVRDVGRVLGHPYGFVDKIAKLIPLELGITLEKAIATEATLRERYEQEEDVSTLLDLALKLEGITRNAGKHAGGVVIAPTTLTDFAPLFCEPDSDHYVTQFDKDDIESVGLVKFDFLGLRTLTIINWAVLAINKRLQSESCEPIRPLSKLAAECQKQGAPERRTGAYTPVCEDSSTEATQLLTSAVEFRERSIDINLIPIDDADSYTLMKNCATTAVFQLESRGMKDLIKRLQPDCFEEVIALVALFRPGPLQSGMVDDFIDRKHGRAQVISPHPDIEPILRPTYGVILYQEQVMQIAQVLAGYTLGAADLLRRAMGKKKAEEMAQQREIFVSGSVARGVDSQLASDIFDLMEKFAGYGFNKSHSAAYALVAYQTAWLKAHYPSEFMAAVLSSDMDNTDKVVTFVDECKNMKLVLSPPDINESAYPFSATNEGRIVYGLGAIKGVGEAMVNNLVNEREKNGVYKDLFDFCRRVDLKKANKRVFEALIGSGAMDCFQMERSVLFASIGKAVQLAESALRNQSIGQADLFGFNNTEQNNDSPPYLTASPWSHTQRLRWEKETLGMYFSGHPIECYRDEIIAITGSAHASQHIIAGKNAKVAGFVVASRTLMTKRGDRMAFVSLDDGAGRIELAVFSDVLQLCHESLNSNQLLIVEGDVSIDDFNDNLRMSARNIITIEEARERHAKEIIVLLTPELINHERLQQLQLIIKTHAADYLPIMVHYQSEMASCRINLSKMGRVEPTDECLNQLKTLFGEEAVKVGYIPKILQNANF